MSSSTSDLTASDDERSSSPFRWPTGPWTVTLMLLITVGSVAFLGALVAPMTIVGAWGYAAWPAAAVVTLLAMVSAARFDAGPRADRPRTDALGHVGPPFVRRFHARMGGWGTYVATIGQVVGTITATAAIAVVVATVLLPGGGVVARLAGVAFLVLLVVARAYVPEPRRVVTVVVVAGAVLGLIALAIWLAGVEGALTAGTRPQTPVTVTAVLEATALLPFAFLPLLRMSAMASSLDPGRQQRIVRWALPLTLVATVGLGAFLGHAIEGALDPVSATVAALARAVSEGPTGVGLAAQSVALVLSTLVALVFFDDTVLVGSRLLRFNAIPDIFAAPEGRRVSLKGELLVLAIASGGVLLAPRAEDLISFSAFCILVVFGSLHVAVMRPRPDGRHQVTAAPMIGLMTCVALLFSLPPEIILTGVTLVSLAVLVRAVFIVWSEPLVPDIVEGVGRDEGAQDSAAAAGGPEDAPRDLSPDDGAGGAQHRLEGG